MCLAFRNEWTLIHFLESSNSHILKKREREREGRREWEGRVREEERRGETDKVWPMEDLFISEYVDLLWSLATITMNIPATVLPWTHWTMSQEWPQAPLETEVNEQRCGSNISNGNCLGLHGIMPWMCAGCTGSMRYLNQENEDLFVHMERSQRQMLHLKMSDGSSWLAVYREWDYVKDISIVAGI